MQPAAEAEVNPYVVDGELQTDYRIGVLEVSSLPHKPCIQVLFIANIDDRVLVAWPMQVSMASESGQSCCSRQLGFKDDGCRDSCMFALRTGGASRRCQDENLDRFPGPGDCRIGGLQSGRLQRGVHLRRGQRPISTGVGRCSQRTFLFLFCKRGCFDSTWAATADGPRAGSGRRAWISSCFVQGGEVGRAHPTSMLHFSSHAL